MSKLSSFLFKSCAAVGALTLMTGVSNVGVGLHHGYKIGESVATGMDFEAAATKQMGTPELSAAYKKHPIAVSTGLRIATGIQGIYPQTAP